MNSAENGVIFFSFGTYLNTNEIPEEKWTQIIESLGSLKQKVLMRVGGKVENLPPNVLARQWFFQNEIIAHPKMVLFIGQGGLLSVQEATYHAVPMLLIPFFNDQQRIAEQVAQKGHGKVMNFDDITKENFTETIREIINNNQFKQKALQASELFKDNLVAPMNEAMYWMDYTVRYQGAQHLKSPSVKFSLAKYLNYDVCIFYFVLALVSLLSWYIFIKMACRCYQKREQKGKFKYN
jgi:glucuronosyltransferase